MPRWARHKIKLCQDDRPRERLWKTSNQQQSNGGIPLSMTLYGCPRPKVPCTARVKVLLDSLVPVSEPRWWRPHCPERGENWRVFSSCQHYVTLISFSDAQSWHLQRFDRMVAGDHRRVLFKGSGWHCWHFALLLLLFSPVQPHYVFKKIKMQHIKGR